MTQPAISVEQAATFERCMSVGGVAVFPSDTIYGLACDPASREAVERVYALKRRPRTTPAAVMFFQLDLLLAAVPELGPRTAAALDELLPAAVTVLLPNPEGRFPLACGADSATLGLRVPSLPPALAAFETVRWPILQTSANLSGGPEAQVLADVPEELRGAVDLVLDGGELPGLASTVIDLRGYEDDGSWSIVRPGALPQDRAAEALG